LLATYLRPQLRSVVILTVLLCGGTALQLINPQILRSFIDAATAQGRGANLTVLAGLFIAIAIAQQVLAVVATYVGERVGWTATNALRVDLALHLLQLDLAFHKERTPGELIERVDGDVTALANFFSQFVIQVLGSLLLLLGVLGVLWFVDWRVGLALTVFAAVILAGMMWLRAVATPYWTADRQASAELFGFVEERLAGLVDLRANGAPPYVMRRLYEHVRRRYRAGNKAIVMGTFPWTVPIVGIAMGNALAFGLAAFLYKAASLTLGGAFLIYYYTQTLFQPINLISNQFDDFQKASAGATRIQELMSIQSLLPDGPGTAFPTGALAVEFQGVTFGYDDDEAVLRDLSLRVEPGCVLGLLGRTGSGKTTLICLLARLYDPQEGRILLGGIDLRAARRADVRERIGLVTQDVQLFRATVRDNLTFFDRAIDDARIVAALATLGLADWLGALPLGLDTMLEAGGGGLSAGEAQLLAFTRVFLKDPGLIILDEASSRLDPSTERLIERAVDALLRGRTGIIIAHRLATVERADAILILDDGAIGEYGPRVALASDGASRFSHLLRAGAAEVLA
jgi:ABC-type multidrug transport system fused ATPase/permease subunit